MPKPADVPSLREGHSPDIGVIWPPQRNLVPVSAAFFATSPPARSCWVRSSGYPVSDVLRRCTPNAAPLVAAMYAAWVSPHCAERRLPALTQHDCREL